MVVTERLFLAIALPNCVRSRLAESVRAVAGRTKAVRWVPSENVHITLKFLGDTSPDRRAAVESAMERVVSKVRSLSLAITGVKVVRRRRRPHMVWAIVADSDEQLLRLHGRTDRLLGRDGFARETRSFSPHVTLARVREGISPLEERVLVEWASGLREIKPLAFTVDKVDLMKSELKPRGAEYTLCKRFELQ